MLFAVSRCLDPHPAVLLESIGWSAEAEHVPVRRAGDTFSTAEPGTPRDAPGSVHVPVLRVEVQGRIDPFDGDYRRALEQVNALADSLRAVSGVVAVEVLSLPLDVGSGASLRGDAGTRAGAGDAPFSLRILWGHRAWS